MSDGSDYHENTQGVAENDADIRPLEEVTGETLLNAIGIDDIVENLSVEDKANLIEAEQYVRDILVKQGKTPTQAVFNRVLDSLKVDLGLDSDSEAAVVLDRIAGVSKAWKSLSFIKDPSEKRGLFMKLARQKDSSAMNRLVFEEMEKRSVWQ